MVMEVGKFLPSGMVRALIYKNLFEAHHIHVDYISRHSEFLSGLIAKPYFNNRLLNLGLVGAMGRMGAVVAHGREKRIVQQARRGYDVIYLQKVESLDLIARLKEESRARLVFDMVDGLWLPASSNFAKGKLREILALVDAVTCDNPHGLEFARSYNPNTFLVPDPSQVELFDAWRSRFKKPQTPLILGWIGSPYTTFNLFAIWEALEKIFSRHQNIRLRLIGTGHDCPILQRFERIRFDTVPYYSNATLMEHVLGMDIGLFPLFDVEESKARGILKATIYMSGEAAVIASPRGQVTDLIADGINGFVANSTNEWVEKLELLINDHALRRRLAAAGLETVRQDFSLERSFQCLRAALKI